MRIDCFVCVMFLLLLWSLNPESSEKVSLFVIFHDFPWIWMLGRQHFTPWSYSLVNLFFYMMIADKDVSHFVIVKQFGKRLCLAVLFMLSLTYNNPWVRCFQKEETKSLFFPRWHVTCSRSEESLDYLLLITIFVFVASSISKCECLWVALALAPKCYWSILGVLDAKKIAKVLWICIFSFSFFWVFGWSAMQMFLRVNLMTLILCVRECIVCLPLGHQFLGLIMLFSCVGWHQVWSAHDLVNVLVLT